MEDDKLQFEMLAQMNLNGAGFFCQFFEEFSKNHLGEGPGKEAPRRARAELLNLFCLAAPLVSDLNILRHPQMLESVNKSENCRHRC